MTVPNSGLCECPPGGVSHLLTAYCSTCEVAVPSAQLSNGLDEINVDFGKPIQFSKTTP